MQKYNKEKKYSNLQDSIFSLFSLIQQLEYVVDTLQSISKQHGRHLGFIYLMHFSRPSSLVKLLKQKFAKHDANFCSRSLIKFCQVLLSKKCIRRSLRGRKCIFRAKISKLKHNFLQSLYVIYLHT